MRRLLLGLLTSLLIVGSWLPAASSVAAAPRLEVSPTGTPGLFEFIATGYRVNETISTWLTGPSQQVVASSLRKVDQVGGVLFTVRLPRFYEAGRWALTAHGLRSNEQAIVFFDLPDRGADIEAELQPAAGSPGTTFVMTASGFRARERVSTWLTGPDGGTSDGPVVAASSAGAIRIEIFTQPDMPPGQWALSAYGGQSDRLALATFRLLPADA